MEIKGHILITIDTTCCMCLCAGSLLVSRPDSSLLIRLGGRDHYCGEVAKLVYEYWKSNRNSEWSFFNDPFGAINHCYNKDGLSVIDHSLKEMPAKTVFPHAIRHLKEQSLQQIRHSGGKYVSPNDFVWEFTLPPDWSDIAVQTFKTAVFQTGIPLHLFSVERKEINISPRTNKEVWCEGLANKILMLLSPLVIQLQLPKLEEFQHKCVNDTLSIKANFYDQNHSFHLLVDNLRMQKSSISEKGLFVLLKEILQHLESLAESREVKHIRIELQQILVAVRNSPIENRCSNLTCDRHSIRKCKQYVEDGTCLPTTYNQQHTSVHGKSGPCKNSFRSDCSHLFTVAANGQNSGIPLNGVAIAGLYRTGKSYLMNSLAGKTSGDRHNRITLCRLAKMARLDWKENTSDDTNSSVELEEVQFDETERDIGSKTDIECDEDPYCDEILDCDSETSDDNFAYMISQIPAMINPNREEDSLKEIPQPNYPDGGTKKGNIPTTVSSDFLEIDNPQTFDVSELPKPHKVLGYEQKNDVSTVAEKLSEDETFITLKTVKEEDNAGLTRIATDKDLECIVQSVGSDWNMLGLYLKENAMVKEEQIKGHHHGTATLIFNQLLTWRNEAATNTTLGHLLYQMLQVGTSVTAEWETIEKNLDIDETDKRACNLPPDILRMDSNSIELYKKMLQEGHSSVHNIRVMVVGHHGIGKASLINRLCGERVDFTKRQCTNGIDVHVNRCKILEDILWLPAEKDKDKAPGWKIITVIRHSNFQSCPKLKLESKIRYDENRSRILIFSPVHKEYAWNIACFNRGIHVLDTRKIQQRNMDHSLLIYQVLSAQQFMENRNLRFREMVVHMDLKPENIVFDCFQNARLIEFGLLREIIKADSTCHWPEPKLSPLCLSSEILDIFYFSSILLHFGPDPVEKNTMENEFWRHVGKHEVGANVLKAGYSKLADNLDAMHFFIWFVREEGSTLLLHRFMNWFGTRRELNKLALQEVISGGEQLYERFKQYLKNTNQDTLLQHLTELEDKFYRKRFDNYLKKTTGEFTYIKRVLIEVQNTWVRFEGEPLTESQQTLKGRQLALLSTGRLQNFGDSGDHPGPQDVHKGQQRLEEVSSCPHTSSLIFVLISLFISCVHSTLSSKTPVKSNTFSRVIFLALLCVSQAGYTSYPGQNDGTHFVEPFDGALVQISKAWELVEEIKGGRNDISELDIFNDLVDYDELLFGEFGDGWLPFKIKGDMHIKQFNNEMEVFEVQCGRGNILLENITKLGLNDGQTATEWVEIRVCVSDPVQNRTKFHRENFMKVYPENVRMQCFTDMMDLQTMKRCKDETMCLNCTNSKQLFTGEFEITHILEELMADLTHFVFVVVTATLVFCCMIYEQSCVRPRSTADGATIILCMVIPLYVTVLITWRVKKENTSNRDLALANDIRLESEVWNIVSFFIGIIGQNLCGESKYDMAVKQTFKNTPIKFTDDSGDIFKINLCFESGANFDDWIQNVQNDCCRGRKDQQKGFNTCMYREENNRTCEMAEETGSDECVSEPKQNDFSKTGVGCRCLLVLIPLLLYAVHAIFKKYFSVKSSSSEAQETGESFLNGIDSEQEKAERMEHSCHLCKDFSHSETTETESEDYICLQGKGKTISHEDIEKEKHFQHMKHLTAEVYKSKDTVLSNVEPLVADDDDDIYIHDSVATKAYFPSINEEILFENAIENATDVDIGSFEEETPQKKYEDDSLQDDLFRQYNGEIRWTINGIKDDDFTGSNDENENIDAGFAKFEENQYVGDECEENNTVDFVRFENECEVEPENCSDQDEFIKQEIKETTNDTIIDVLAHSNSEAQQKSSGIDEAAQDSNEAEASNTGMSSMFFMAEIEKNSSGKTDMSVTIPPAFGASLPLEGTFVEEVPKKSKLRLKVLPIPTQRDRQKSLVQSIEKMSTSMSWRKLQSSGTFKNLKYKVEVEEPRKKNIDCTLTEDELDTMLAVRACTWLPLNELPVPKIDITVAFAPQFEPLMSIIDLIANGTPPTPHISMRYELLRFCTLRSYPKENKPYLIKLAEAGFYYASDGDGVVCYCCGVRRYNWVAEDNPMKIHERINPNCKYLRKNEEVNVPVKFFGPFSETLMAIMDIPEPRERPEQSEDVNNDWAPERIRSPAPAQQNRQVETGANSLGINTAVPKHTQYATKTAREGSYSGWPDSASHTPQELADAGFFYAGFGDCVRCFYCGIGLRHWTKEDNPWIEHARWSRNCVFVKQKKGEEFVNLVQLAVQYSQDNEAQSNSSAGNQLPVQEIERILLSDAAQSVLEMGYQPRIIKKAIEQILGQDGNAKITAQVLMEKVLEIEEAENPTQAAPVPTQAPVEAAASTQAKPAPQAAKTEGVKDKEGSQAAAAKAEKKPEEGAKPSVQSKDKKETKTNSESKELSAEDVSQDPKAIKAENEQLKEQTLCKVCLDNTVCIVFLPCGHLVTCADCAPAMRKCPICRALVKGTVRTYMS